MKIAITGAGGFLGTELLRQLSEKDDVTVYAFTFDFERERETYIHSDHIITLDNSEAGSFDYSGIDVLINCAFPRNVSDESFAGGLVFIQKVIEKAAADHVGAVINISSQSVYSQVREKPADEQAAVILESKYAVGKYWSELFVNTVCKHIRHTNLRMASLIGAGFNQRITNKFAMKVIHAEQITLSGGNQLFGFLDVRDAASGILKIAMDSGDWAPVYNLGNNAAYTLLEIAETAVAVGKTVGCAAPAPLMEGTGEWQNSALCCRAFCSRFEWKAEYTLESTYRAIFDNLKERA